MLCVPSGAILGAGVWATDLLLQPIPMPAGGAAVLAWLGFWLSPRLVERRSAVVGFVLGALIGVVFHVRSHIVEDRVDSASALAMHVAGDLAVSALAAAVVLVASVGWVGVARRGA
jgi:hypothetical protein